MAVIIVFLIALNSSLIADQALAWVKANPKDPTAPDVLYRAGRFCDVMGNNDKAVEIYWMLYEEFPERGDICAPALYYCGNIKASASYILAIRKQALPYLDIVVNQYSNQQEWRTKAKQLYDEVNYAH